MADKKEKGQDCSEQEDKDNRTPALGDIVLYTLDGTIRRPAIVIDVTDPRIVNLQLFIDGTNDANEIFRREEIMRGVVWITGAVRGDNRFEWNFRD